MCVERAGVASDAELIAASLEHPELFGLIFNRHAGAVFKYLVRRVAKPDAEDLLAETFTTAFRMRVNYDGNWPVALPWLLGIAVNVARHHQRAGSARARLHRLLSRSAVHHHDATADADDRLSAASEHPRVLRALDALAPALREAVLLAAMTDLDYRAMAEVLGVPIGTVRSRLSRGRRKLRELLGPLDDPATPRGRVAPNPEEQR